MWQQTKDKMWYREAGNVNKFWHEMKIKKLLKIILTKLKWQLD